jgi:glycosyltransferase involved in cell wall biosynthesis
MSTQTPLKIALVHAADLGGGAESSFLRLHAALRRLGHDSTLYVGAKHTQTPGVKLIDRKRPIPGLLRISKWCHDHLGMQGLYAPWFRRLDRILEPQPDIIHLQTLWGSEWYADLAALPRLSHLYPTLLTLQDAWMFTGHCACPLNCDRWKRQCGSCPDLTNAPAVTRDATRWNFARKKRLLSKSRLRVTTVSDWLRHQAQTSPIVGTKKIDVVYNGVDETTFSPCSQELARKKLGVDTDRFVVLMSCKGNPTVTKGLRTTAVDALNRIGSQRLQVVLVGHGCESIAKLLKVPTTVVGLVNSDLEMANCYNAANITVVPSEFETFGCVAAESQLCGIPVVAFHAGGLPEVVQDGESGLVVPPFDEPALYHAVTSLMEDPSRLERMGHCAVQHARTQFAMNTVAERFVGIYRELITDQ